MSRKLSFERAAKNAAFFFDPAQGGGDKPASPAWTLRHTKDKRSARPAVKVNFAGTVGDDANGANNEKTLRQAIFILSQSATGRDALERMTQEGYHIVFDNARTGARDAGGICDPVNKLLILRGHKNPEYLALLIGHEAVHAVQNARHDLFPTTRHRVETGIKLSFAIEADAYAQQCQIALELAHGDPEGPPTQVRFEGPLKQMRKRFPDIVDAAQKVMTSKEALQNGACVAAAFQAFYDNFHLRTFYEDAHMAWAQAQAPGLKGARPSLEQHFSKEVEGDWIKNRILHRGLPYLALHARSLSFDDARHAGVSDVTRDKIVAFYQEHMGKKRPDLKSFGIHMKDAARWVLGLSRSVCVVFKKPQAPPLPPSAQSLKRRKWG